MKTKFKLKPSLSPLVLSSIVTHRSLASSFLLLGSVALVGCQSTGASLSSNDSIVNASQSAAKSALSNALQQRRRSSFSYHSNIEISNEQQFANIDKTQLVAADSVESYCEDTHDNAYADMVAQAQTQKLEISAPQYTAQRTALKKSYLECSAAYQAWNDNRPNEDYRYDYDEYGSEDSETLLEDPNDTYVIESASETENKASESAETVGIEGATIVETSKIKSNKVVVQTHDSTESEISPYYQQRFDEYDNKLTPLDIKKAQLLDNYLLQPLSLNAQGVYQPLAGKFTMLMSAQYQARNNQTSVNQPIYVDFKTGNIYLWADNFALLTSEFADDKLGTQWQNKWLKLAIDDGSLPKGFGSALIKAHLEALDRTYEAAPITQFDYVAPNSLVTMSPKLPTAQLNAIATLPTKQVIRRVQSAESYEQFYRDYVSIFYEQITKQYPELIKTESSYESEASYELNASRFDAAEFTSKVLVQQVLAVMKNVTDRQADTLVSEVFSASTQPDRDKEVADNNQQPTIQLLYGLNQRGQIQWQHQRSHYTNSQNAAKGVTIDVLQQYTPVTSATAFPNLPADRQIPKASNSVDLRQYGRELMEYYRDGNGTGIGKMLYSTLPITKAMYASMIEQAAMNQSQYEEGSVEDTEESIE